jgi:hypothetical protein
MILNKILLAVRLKCAERDITLAGLFRMWQ